MDRQLKPALKMGSEISGLSYPSPGLTPVNSKYPREQEALATPAAAIPDWNTNICTPPPVGDSQTPKVKHEASSMEDNEGDNVWDNDVSFEVNSNLISEIHQKYGNDYLNSTEYQTLSSEFINEDHHPASEAEKQLGIYPCDLSWSNEDTYQPNGKRLFLKEVDEEEFAPKEVPSKPSARIAKRRATSPIAKKKLNRVAKDPAPSSKPAIRRWTESDDDKVAFLREYGNLKWHEVTEFINGRHTPQAVQMRYLRSLKRRNDTLTAAERAKLEKLIVEDYEGRFKRISTQMGPAFTQIRIQRILMEDAGMSDLLKPEKTWTPEDIARFVDEAAGDFDSFVLPYRADELPARAERHMKKFRSQPYDQLVRLYVGSSERAS